MKRDHHKGRIATWTDILVVLKLCGIIGKNNNPKALRLLRNSGRAKRVARGRYQLVR